jgi:hypothetical protein
MEVRRWPTLTLPPIELSYKTTNQAYLESRMVSPLVGSLMQRSSQRRGDGHLGRQQTIIRRHSSSNQSSTKTGPAGLGPINVWFCGLSLDSISFQLLEPTVIARSEMSWERTGFKIQGAPHQIPTLRDR